MLDQSECVTCGVDESDVGSVLYLQESGAGSE